MMIWVPFPVLRKLFEQIENCVLVYDDLSTLSLSQTDLPKEFDVTLVFHRISLLEIHSSYDESSDNDGQMACLGIYPSDDESNNNVSIPLMLIYRCLNK